MSTRSHIRNVEFLEQFAATHRFASGRPSGIQITRDADAVLFLRSGPRNFENDLVEFDPLKGTELVLVTAARLLGERPEELTAEERARRERMRMSARGIASFSLSPDGQSVLIPLSGRIFLLDRGTLAVRELTSAAGPPIDVRFSPDGEKLAAVRNGEVYVMDIATGAEKRLTTGASETLTNGLAEFVAQEEMNRMRGYWWSPDSREILYQQTDSAEVEVLSIADPAQPGQRAQEWRYPRAGKSNANVRLGVVSVAGGETRWLDWNREQFPYLATVTWEENAPLTVLVQNRPQSREQLLEIDPDSGATKLLLEETDEAWLNLDGGLPKWSRDGKSFLWSSERSGAWQLELRNRDGSLKRVLTPNEFNYRSLVGIDWQGSAAIVAGGENPTEVHLYRVPLAAGSPERLTKQPGIHSAVLAKDDGLYVQSSQSLEESLKHVVIGADGSAIGELASVAETPSLRPNVEIVALDGQPRFYAAITRPSDFKPGRRYPVIVSVYGGPHAQMVMAAGARYLIDGWLAEQGFIVVSIDGRGTPARGRAWERAIRGDFIGAPLADQVAAIGRLGEKYPELDLGRVGIFGWSFGGYFSAMAVMQRPDIFHAGVAGAPVTDWHDYDTHYTERYLGLPQEQSAAYAVSSALNAAGKLERPLLLIHGTADDNVYFLHSVRLADALFRSGRSYDFLPLAGQTHMVSDPPIVRELYVRIAEYFIQHLRPGE